MGAVRPGDPRSDPDADAKIVFNQHLQTERAALFTCLTRPDVAATNWQAEQAIRLAVVPRKVCGGNRTPPGAATPQVLASVLRTASQQQRDPLALLVALQRSPSPVVAGLTLS